MSDSFVSWAGASRTERLACSRGVSFSEAQAQCHAICAWITQQREDRAGVSGLRAHVLKIVRVEGVLDPEETFEHARRRHVAGAEIDKTVAVDHQILGIGGIRI